MPWRHRGGSARKSIVARCDDDRLNGFELETPSIPRNFGLGSSSCVVSFEPMSVLYGICIVAAMYLGQTWLLFPTALAPGAQRGSASFVQPETFEVRTPDGEA